jgi:hypothetical protein
MLPKFSPLKTKRFGVLPTRAPATGSTRSFSA